MNLIILPPDMISRPIESNQKGGQDAVVIHVAAASEIGKHITGVLRSSVGDTLSVGVLDGSKGSVCITEITERFVILQGTLPLPMDPPNPIILGVGYSRPISMKRILREAAMLGAQEVWLYPTDLGEKSYQFASIWKDEKYKKHLIDGASQGGTTCIPRIRFFDSLESLLRTCESCKVSRESEPLERSGALPKGFARVVCDVGTDANPLIEILQGTGNTSVSSTGALVCIGSERGWSQRERSLFRASGFSVASLGSRILRTETACAVVLGVGELVL